MRPFNSEVVVKKWSGKKVLITGVCGTVGRELFNILKDAGVAEIVGLDNNESELFFLEQEYLADPRFNFYLCDLRDAGSLENRMRGIDVVLHSAAFKHVGLCERSPRSAVTTNIIGTQNVIDAAYAAKVKRVLLTSSDKAVNPTNVMGTSKLMGERLMTSANMRFETDSEVPAYASTRFGNVLGSRGSVIPVFMDQIAKGGPVTVTDREMSRFIMTLEQAARLVLDTALMFRGGEVFITKMPVINIADLAEVMIEEVAPAYGHNPADINIQYIGVRPGEKMYEELMTSEESCRALECDDFFIIRPAIHNVEKHYQYPGVRTEKAGVPYTSATSPVMGKEELRAYLHANNLLGTASKPGMKRQEVTGEEIRCADRVVVAAE